MIHFIENITGEEIVLVGTICSNIKTTNYRYIVTIKIDKLSSNREKLNNNFSKEYKNSKLILNIKKNEKEISRLNYGNKILLIGTYEEPEESRNYKGFSYKEYLKTKGIYGTLIVDNMDKINVIKQNNIDLIHLYINKLSQKFDNNLRKILPQETANLAKGIVLGDSSDITDEIKDNFKDCNLSHMLAVSGSHLAYLLLGLNLILNKKIIGIRNTKIIKITIIIIFMMITRKSPSIVRAGISVILAIMASLIKRKSDTYTTIAIATLFTLIRNPFTIFNVGMQLSYLGTIGILLFNQKIQGYLERKSQIKLKKINEAKDDLEKTNDNSLLNKILMRTRKYVIQSISVTSSANILIFPLIVYNFNNISLNFIISNLIAGPILGICIVLGLITLLTSIISIPFAKILAIPFNLFLNLLIKITNLISKIPMSNITVVTPHIVIIIVIYTVIFTLLIAMGNNIIKCLFEKIINNKKKENKFIKHILFKVVCILSLILIISTNILTTLRTNNKLTIHFVDVGQGDSSLISTPTGKNILIDGGGNRDSEQYDVGEKVVVPYLLDRRIKKLDYVIVSHFDADHAQGLEAVIKTIKVKNIVISKQASICSEYEKIIDLCKKRKIKIMVVKRGEKIPIDKYTYFDILHPSDKMLDDGKGGLNANAIVAKLYFKINEQKRTLSISTAMNNDNIGFIKNKINDNIKIKTYSEYFTILFTGDIEEDAEQELVEIYGDKLKCDVLKVAHHGSKTSSTYEFLKYAKPIIALIGVGKDNRFGHPNSGVIERLESIKAKIFRTDLNGEITIEIA